MSTSDLPQRWKERLVQFTDEKYGPDYKHRGSLSANDFPISSGIEIRFLDASQVRFNFAFVIVECEWNEVAVFTEHCGYHVFPLGETEIKEFKVPILRLTFLEIVEALCKRPKMYTENGTFGEIVSYLDGYAKGKGLSGGYHYSFTPFRNWLEANYAEDTEERRRLDDRGDHPLALAEFARLYREYEESQSKEGK